MSSIPSSPSSLSSLPIQDWMRDGDTVSVFQALTAAGATPRFVGGCVRDALLGRAIGDVDIAVDIEPPAVQSALQKAGIRTVPTGIDHGTITAVLSGHTFEVTSLRRDVETDGRRAVVAFTRDWREDSLRRDFTVNALYLDLDGTLHDFHGGLADLAIPRLRFIGDADLRIREDVLRILRFFRFHAQLGISPLDPDGLAACRHRRDLLSDLSAERVQTEFLRLLQADQPGDTLRVMIDDGFLSHWLPEAADVDSVDRLVALERRRGECDPVRRLAVLCGDTAAMADRLKLSNRQRERLLAMAQRSAAPGDEALARQMIYRIGQDAARDRALIGLAHGEAAWGELLNQTAAWQAPEFPLSGRDALAAGLAPGPQVGDILARLEDHWIQRGFQDGRTELLELLKGEVKHG